MNLPPEIIEYTLDFLYSHRTTLAICGLVSKAFLAASRYHLVSEVYVRQVKEDTLHTRGHFGFADLVFNELCTFPVVLRNLHLIGSPSVIRSLRRLDDEDDENDEAEFVRAQHEWLQRTLGSLVRLPILSSLGLASLDLRQALLGRDSTPFLPSLTTNISRLLLYSINFDSLRDVAQLVCQFAHLNRLYIEDVQWNGSNSDPSLKMSFPPVQHLTLSACYKRDFLHFLLPSGSLEGIVIPHLDLGIISSPHDSAALGSYLSFCGPNLKSLSLGFDSLDAGGDAEDFYASCVCAPDHEIDEGITAHSPLSKNISIEKFCVRPFVRLGGAGRYQFSSPVGWILRVLEELVRLAELRVAKELREVVLGIHLLRIEDLDEGSLSNTVNDQKLDVSWLYLDSLLTRALPHGTCTFEVHGQVELESVRCVLIRLLPELAVHGRFRVCRE